MPDSVAIVIILGTGRTFAIVTDLRYLGVPGKA